MFVTKRVSVRLDRNPNWHGGRYVESGYIMVKAENHPRANRNGYVFEHILVLERKLGRSLQPDEVSHHLDENRQNNDPSNLEALTRTAHNRLHRSTAKYQLAKTHCPKGHPYDDENTYVNPKGSRVCRICKRARAQT